MRACSGGEFRYTELMISNIESRSALHALPEKLDVLLEEVKGAALAVAQAEQVLGELKAHFAGAEKRLSA